MVGPAGLEPTTKGLWVLLITSTIKNNYQWRAIYFGFNPFIYIGLNKILYGQDNNEQYVTTNFEYIKSI